jgi:Rieske Fe-S protein
MVPAMTDSGAAGDPSVRDPGAGGNPPEPAKRDFLKVFMGGGLAALAASILYPVLAYLRPPPQAEAEVSSVPAGTKGEIERESGKIIRFGSKPVLLVRTAADEFKAFDATCTHLDCTVQYNRELGMIWCACHNGKYDLRGRNVAGPPPAPLKEYKVVVNGDEIVIVKES